MNKQLTTILKNVKDTGLLAEHVFSEKGKPYGDVKTEWWKALTTNNEKAAKVVSIGNH